MSDDFSLDRSKWFNKTGLERASAWARDDAVSIAAYVGKLNEFEHDAEIEKAIGAAETALSEALLAVKLAKSSYDKHYLATAE